MDEVECAVVGAGVVGRVIARALAARGGRAGGESFKPSFALPQEDLLGGADRRGPHGIEPGSRPHLARVARICEPPRDEEHGRSIARDRIPAALMGRTRWPRGRLSSSPGPRGGRRGHRLGAREAGCGIAVNYSKDAAPAEQVAEACISAGGDALVIRADVADDTDCRRMAAAALKRWGRIDGLVNNAGTTRFVSMRDLEALSAEDFHRIYSVNLIGPYQMVRACEAALRAARGAVVNVSSIAASMGVGSSYAYACSKGALNTLTLALARSLAPEIRVNDVLPGFIETRWPKQGLGNDYEVARKAYREKSSLATTLTPEEVAASIVALLEAKKVTGQLHTIDAGRGLGTS